jgi:ribosomal protein S18 acetylase RimI-like enzyme
MHSLAIRPARPADANSLATAILESDRGHLGVGSWDFVLHVSDPERLAMIAKIVTSEHRSYAHWSTFLVAESDGSVAGAVASYVPRDTTEDAFEAAFIEALGANAWREMQEREATAGSWSRSYFRHVIPDDTLRLEWVYTLPEWRSRGISRALIERHVDRARDRRIATSHVGTYIGNEPAIATYKRAGYEVYAETRHQDYARRFGAEGIVSLRRKV